MKNGEIERLRAFAILLVLLQHLERLKNTLPEAFRSGGAGVQLFFVISGYVVARSLLRTMPSFAPSASLLDRMRQAKPALAAFMVRRVYRILPMSVAWALIPLSLALVKESPQLFGTCQDLLREIFAILTLQYNYAFAYGNGGHLGWYWSLAVEEHFYLFLPMFLVVFGTAQRRIVATFAGIALVAFVLRPFVHFDGPHEWAWAYAFTSHRNFDFLFAGVAIFLLRDAGFLELFGEIPRRWALLLAQVSLFAIWVMQAELPSAYFLGSGQLALEAFAVLAVLLASFEQNIVLPVPGLTRALEWLGSRSFGVYLIHAVVIHVGDFLAGRTKSPEVVRRVWESPWIQGAMVVGGSILVADICYRVLEKPLLDRGHRVAKTYLNRTARAEDSAIPKAA